MEINLTAKDLEEVQYINSQLKPTDYPPRDILGTV